MFTLTHMKQHDNDKDRSPNFDELDKHYQYWLE